jgi:hypothetical protein
MHREVGCMGAFLKYLTEPTSLSYKGRLPLHNSTSTHKRAGEKKGFIPT